MKSVIDDLLDLKALLVADLCNEVQLQENSTDQHSTPRISDSD